MRVHVFHWKWVKYDKRKINEPHNYHLCGFLWSQAGSFWYVSRVLLQLHCMVDPRWDPLSSLEGRRAKPWKKKVIIKTLYPYNPDGMLNVQNQLQQNTFYMPFVASTLEGFSGLLPWPQTQAGDVEGRFIVRLADNDTCQWCFMRYHVADLSECAWWWLV